MVVDSPEIAPALTDVMEYSYSLFGLAVRTNEPLPGLEPIEGDSRPTEVEIFLQTRPSTFSPSNNDSDSLIYASSAFAESGEPVLRVSKIKIADGSLFRVDYYDCVKFWLNLSGDKVWTTWPDSSSLEDVATYLLGPMLGFLLRLRGVTCLHASAVALEGCAIAFAGVHAAGKSTTAAAMAHRGHAVIADDIVALSERDGHFFVLPAYPYLSLWPQSVDLLYGSPSALPPFSRNWEKRRLALGENRLRFAGKPLPLAAIYLLGPRTPDTKAPFIENPAPTESLLALVADTYASNLIDREMRVKEFELLGRLLKTVPVFRLHAHEDRSRLDQLCELIERTGYKRLLGPTFAATHP